MKKLFIGLFLFGLIFIGVQVFAVEQPVEELVCCESFGYGAYMVKTSSSYEMMSRSKCVIETGLVGGGRNIVDNSFCKSDINTPVISGVSGPQSLSVNQTGTWTVKASSSYGGNLSYSVDWGDVNQLFAMSTTSSLKNTQQSATFTHSYSKAGVYTPTFTVTSENTIRCITTPCWSNSGSAKTSLSVKVSNSTNTCRVGCTCTGEVTVCPVEPVDDCLPGHNYNSTTGQKCPGIKDDDGCLPGYNYSPKTGQACPSVISATTIVVPQTTTTSSSIEYPTTSSSSTSITRTLRRGIKGDDVKILQSFLEITADGSFGPQTQQKVMEWQAQNGLKVDGLFGIQSATKAGLID